MLNNPFFSIATPCWNSVLTIERTIKSVLAQNFKNYEYIIVDGGSTDGTIEIIKKYEPLFEGRMKWKSEPDEGLYDAFNKGIDQSTGVYCWNVNADDFIEPDALNKVYRFLRMHCYNELPVLSGAMNFISFDGSLIKTIRCESRNLKNAYDNDFIGVNHPATLVPKAVYDKYGVFDPYYKIIGDLDWFHRVYDAGVQFIIMNDVLTNMSDGGISNLFVYKKSLRDRLYFLKKHYPNSLERFWRWFKWTKNFYLTKICHHIKR